MVGKVCLTIIKMAYYLMRSIASNSVGFSIISVIPSLSKTLSEYTRMKKCGNSAY